MNVFAFALRTVPDTATGRRLYGQPDEMAMLSEEDVMRVMALHHQQHNNPDTPLSCHLRQVAVLSVILRIYGRFQIQTLSVPEQSEADVVKSFFENIQQHTPILLSWNGGENLLPVLHFRALRHGISAPAYWNTLGDFQNNNYLCRGHERHIELSDRLCGCRSGHDVPLHEAAALLGLPNQPALDESEVQSAWLNNDHAALRADCEQEALKIYLLYLRFELMRGNLDQAAYDAERDRLSQVLGESYNLMLSL